MKGFIATFETAIAVALAIEHMKIKSLIFTLLSFLAFSLCAVAQTTSNVSGVTLSGPVNDPKIENHSGKAVLVVMMEYASPTGPFRGNTWFIDDSRGLADGDSAKAERRPFKSPITSATIKAAIFADGEFRGEDTGPIHNGLEVTFWLMNEAWRLAQAKEWDKLQVMADKVDDGILPQMAARKLLQARGNDAAMAALAYLWASPCQHVDRGAAMIRGGPNMLALRR